jgi:hypothetical protein
MAEEFYRHAAECGRAHGRVDQQVGCIAPRVAGGGGAAQARLPKPDSATCAITAIASCSNSRIRAARSAISVVGGEGGLDLGDSLRQRFQQRRQIMFGSPC